MNNTLKFLPASPPIWLPKSIRCVVGQPQPALGGKVWTPTRHCDILRFVWRFLRIQEARLPRIGISVRLPLRLAPLCCSIVLLAFSPHQLSAPDSPANHTHKH